MAVFGFVDPTSFGSSSTAPAWILASKLAGAPPPSRWARPYPSCAPWPRHRSPPLLGKPTISSPRFSSFGSISRNEHRSQLDQERFDPASTSPIPQRPLPPIVCCPAKAPESHFAVENQDPAQDITNRLVMATTEPSRQRQFEVVSAPHHRTATPTRHRIATSPVEQAQAARLSNIAPPSQASAAGGVDVSERHTQSTALGRNVHGNHLGTYHKEHPVWS